MTNSVGSVPPPNPLAYEGQVVVPYIIRNFAPLTTFNTFSVPTIWIDPEHTNAYILVAKPQGVADWLPFAGGTGTVLQIDTPDGAHVQPVAGVINFLNGDSMNITGSGNNITFNATGGGLQWIEVTGVSQSMLIDHGYVASNGSLVTLTLPATAVFGSIIKVVGKGAGGWSVAQNAGQEIFFGTTNTTSGTGGSLSSTNARDCITLLCITANTQFEVIDSLGNITYV